jgi:hypothetical protein
MQGAQNGQLGAGRAVSRGLRTLGRWSNDIVLVLAIYIDWASRGELCNDNWCRCAYWHLAIFHMSLMHVPIFVIRAMVAINFELRSLRLPNSSKA